MTKRLSIGILVTIAVCVALTSATVAFLSRQTPSITNTFTPGKVTVAVEETFTPSTGVKKVQGKNTGTVDAYIRIALVPYFTGEGNSILPADISMGMPEDGSLVITGPEGEEVILNFAEALGNWTYQDGMYYFKQSVASEGGLTDLLLESVTGAPQNFNIHVLVESVQASGAAGWEAAWNR